MSARCSSPEGGAPTAPSPRAMTSTSAVHTNRVHSYETAKAKRSHRAQKNVQGKKYIRNQSEINHQFSQGDPFAINYELDLPLPAKADRRSTKEKYVASKKAAEWRKSEADKQKKFTARRKQDEKKKIQDANISYQNMHFLANYRKLIESDDDNMSFITDHSLESEAAVKFTPPPSPVQLDEVEAPLTLGTIIPWVPPYPTITVVTEASPPPLVQVDEYTLCWVNTSLFPWNGESFGDLYTRSIYDVNMPPLSDFTHPAVEFNQIQVFNDRRQSRLAVDESDKDFARSKWRRREENHLKDALRKIQELIKKNKKKTETIQAMRKQIQDKSKPVVDESFLKPSKYDMDHELDQTFMSVINLRRSHIGVSFMFQAMKNSGELNGLKCGYEISRRVAYAIVAQHFGVKISDVQDELISNKDFKRKYLEVVRTQFIFLPGTRFKAIPTVLDRIANTATNKCEQLIVEPPPGPSAMDHCTCVVVKLAALMGQLSTADCWEEALMHVACALIQNSNAQFFAWAFGRSRDTKNIEETVKDFLDARLRKTGVFDPEEVEKEPVPGYKKVEEQIENQEKAIDALIKENDDLIKQNEKAKVSIDKYKSQALKSKEVLKKQQQLLRMREKIDSDSRSILSKLRKPRAEVVTVDFEDESVENQSACQFAVPDSRKVTDHGGFTSIPNPLFSSNPSPERVNQWDKQQNLSTPTIVEIPKRVINESAGSNPFKVLREGVDVARDIVRRGIGIEEKIKEIPILELVDEIVCLVIFFTQEPPSKPTPWNRKEQATAAPVPDNHLYREVLHRAFHIHKTDGLSLISRISTVIDLALMICATLWDGVDYRTLINPLDIHIRLGKLQGYADAYSAGNLDLLHADDKKEMSSEQYEFEVDKLTHDIKTLLENRMVKPQAEQTFVRYLAIAKKMQMVVKMQIKAATEKPLPYMIGLYGKPGVGKSLCTEVFWSVLALACDIKITPQSIWNCHPDPNSWDTGATSAKNVILVTEHDNIKTDENDNMIFFDMARLCDTMPSPFKKPDLETKGLAFNHLKGGVFCCNQKDFGISSKVRDPSATNRRCDFFEVTVKQEFGKPSPGGEHLVPDPEKCPFVRNEVDGNLVPDESVYLIQAYQFVVVDVQGDVSGASRSTKIVPIGEPMTVPEWRSYMFKRIKKRQEETTNYIGGLSRVRAQTLCQKCANPQRSCLCGCFSPKNTGTKTSKSTWRFWKPSKVTKNERDLAELDSKVEDLLGESKLPCLKDPVKLKDESGTPNPHGIPFHGNFFSRQIPLSFALFPVAGVRALLRPLVSGALSSVLHSVFNVYTCFAFSAPFLLVMPPVAIIVFCSMLLMTMCVERVSEAATTRIVGENLKQGEITPYWDTTYRDFLKVATVLAGLGFGMYSLKASMDAKRKKKSQSEGKTKIWEGRIEYDFSEESPQEPINTQARMEFVYGDMSEMSPEDVDEDEFANVSQDTYGRLIDSGYNDDQLRYDRVGKREYKWSAGSCEEPNNPQFPRPPTKRSMKIELMKSGISPNDLVWERDEWVVRSAAEQEANAEHDRKWDIRAARMSKEREVFIAAGYSDEDIYRHGNPNTDFYSQEYRLIANATEDDLRQSLMNEELIAKIMSSRTKNEGMIVESVNDLERRVNQPDQWLQREPIVIQSRIPHDLKTMTLKQLISVIEGNSAIMTTFSLTAAVPTAGCKVLFLTSNTILLPVHRDEVVLNRDYTLNFHGTGNKSVVRIENLFRIQVEGLDTDMCFAVVSTRFPMRNIERLLDHEYAVDLLRSGLGTSAGECVLVTDTQRLGVFPVVAEIRTETRESLGFNSIITSPTRAGDCGSPLITTESPHVILGFHISRVGNDESNCTVVPFSEWKRFLASLTRNQADSVVFSNLMLDNAIPSVPPLPSDEPSRRVCTRFLRNEGPECTQTPPSVFPVGHDVHSRVSNRSQIELTPLSEHLENEGIPRLHDAPPLNANKAASTVLQYGARGSQPRSRPLNEAVIEHYCSKVSEGFVELGVVPRPLDMSEVYSGIPNNRFVKSMALNKACGGGRPGKKRSRTFLTTLPQESEYYMIDPVVDVVRSPLANLPSEENREDSGTISTEAAVVDYDTPVPASNPELDCEVSKIFAAWESGVTCNTLVQGALKDDPALLSKIEALAAWGRLVTSQSMAHHIAQTILFGDVVGFLRALPFVSGCYEGVSYQSQDWHEIADWHLKIGPIEETTFLDADTKKMDLSMCNQDLVATTECLARIVEKCGGDPHHCLLMRRCGYEMSVPLLNLFGEWLFMYMNTSGNKLTITYNNISGVQLRTREAYIAAKVFALDPELFPDTLEGYQKLIEVVNLLSYEEAMELLSSFDREVRVGSIGDDSLLSTTCSGFTMSFVTKYFEAKGVTITGSDKSGVIGGNLQLRELSCCQRGFRFCQHLGRIVGPLNLRSLSRSLHCRMPSTEKPSIVEFEVVRTVMEELSLHGEEQFEDWRQRITAAALAAGRWHIHQKTLTRDFSFYINLMKNRHPTDLDPAQLEDCLNRFNYGKVDGLADQQDARAAHAEDRLPCEDEGEVDTGHSQSAEPPREPPDAGRSQEPKGVTNENDLQNMEMITPSSTTDVTVVAASQSAESKIVTTHDSPVSFTHRPVRLKTYTWNVGANLDFSFDPWTLLMQNQALRNKCEFFRFMRATLVLNVSIQGTDFHSGLAWFVYQPLPGYDEITQYSFSSQPDLIEFSQRPRITISPRDSQGGVMTLPFIFPRDFADMTSDDISKLGRITVRSIVPLRMVNEGTLPCLITVLGHFENLELVMPTVHPLAQLKIVNESALSDPSSYASSSVMIDGGAPQVSTSPSVMWAKSSDTSVASLASRECLVGSFTWSTSTGIDAVLGSFRCSPFHGVISGSGVNTEYHVSPSTWVSIPFSYWSGTCKYRFEVVCSKMHRGQLMLTWDPIYTTKVSEYNKNYSVVFDIGEKTEHVATIGWGQDTPFLPTISTMSEILNHTTATYISSRKYANGVLTMSVFAPLLLPSKLTTSEVTVNVYQSMTPDFKLTLPRAPIASTQVDKNDATDTNSSVSVVSAVTSNPVVNPTVTTQKFLLICEEPIPLLYSIRVPETLTTGGRLDSTFPGPIADVTASLVKLPTNATYSLSARVPLAVDEPAVLRLRGFVEGPTDVEIFRTGGPDSAGGITEGNFTKTTLSGISDVEDILLNNTETDKFYGSFTLNSTNRTQGLLAAYKLPRWAKATLTWDGAGVANLQPNVNWYEYTMVDGRPVLGDFVADQSPTSKSGLAFKIRTLESHKILGNLMVSYISGGPTPSPITVYGKSANWILPNSGAAERRHFANDWDPDDICVVPPECELKVMALTYLVVDDAAVRTAVRSQPILITNQSALDASVVMHGPKCINDHYHEFFQEIVPDIMVLLKRYGTYESFTTGPAGFSGNFAWKLPHFPLQYRTRLNGNNGTSNFAYHYLDYFARAFICMRGSTVMQIRSMIRASGNYPNYVMVRRTDSVTTINAGTATLVETTPSQQGVLVHTIKFNGVCEHVNTWYNPVRFGFARSTTPENHSLYATRLDIGGFVGDRYLAFYKVGDDFSLGHFLSTPVLRAYV